MKAKITLVLILLSFYFIGCSPKGSSDNEFTDSRDGQTYQTVKIGNLIWMVDNLNYKASGSYCYNDKNTNGNIYGRLYTFEQALDAVPPGWRLPTYKEFKSVVEFFKGEENPDVLTKELPKGFNVLYGGSRYYYGEYHGINEYAVFWSSTEYDDEKVYCFSLDKTGDERVTWPDYLKTAGFSVRCVKKAY